MARTREISVTAGDVTLAGTLLLPDDPPPPDRRGRYPNVLLLPSWLPRDRDGAWDRAGHPSWYAPREGDGPPGLLRRLAEALAARGVASLRCDPRGCGVSEGSWEGATLFTRIDDARDQLAAMRSDRALDLRRTGILAHGEGATLALSVAIGDPATSALTLIGPAARPWHAVQRRAAAQRERTGTDRSHPAVEALDRWTEELIERAGRGEATVDVPLPGGGTISVSVEAIEQAMHTPNLALGTMLHRSVSLVHGADDAWSDPDESALLEAVLRDGGNDPRRTVVRNTGHDLAEAGDEVIGEIATDLATRLEPRDLPPVLLAIEQG